MAREYALPCGCKVHVLRHLVSQESCPLHKNAKEVLRVLKDSLAYLDRLDNTEFSYGVRPQDVKAWREVIAKSERKRL